MGVATTVALARVLAKKQRTKERDENGHLEYYVSPEDGAVQFRRAADLTDGAGFAAGRCDCDACRRKRGWRRFAHARFTPLEQHHRRFLFWATRLGMSDDGKEVCWAWVEVIADPDWDKVPVAPIAEEDLAPPPLSSPFASTREALAAHLASDYAGRLFELTGMPRNSFASLTAAELWGLLNEVDYNLTSYRSSLEKKN